MSFLLLLLFYFFSLWIKNIKLISKLVFGWLVEYWLVSLYLDFTLLLFNINMPRERFCKMVKDFEFWVFHLQTLNNLRIFIQSLDNRFQNPPNPSIQPWTMYSNNLLSNQMALWSFKHWTETVFRKAICDWYCRRKNYIVKVINIV